MFPLDPTVPSTHLFAFTVLNITDQSGTIPLEELRKANEIVFHFLCRVQFHYSHLFHSTIHSIDDEELIQFKWLWRQLRSLPTFYLEIKETIEELNSFNSFTSKISQSVSQPKLDAEEKIEEQFRPWSPLGGILRLLSVCFQFEKYEVLMNWEHKLCDRLNHFESDPKASLFTQCEQNTAEEIDTLLKTINNYQSKGMSDKFCLSLIELVAFYYRTDQTDLARKALKEAIFVGRERQNNEVLVLSNWWLSILEGHSYEEAYRSAVLNLFRNQEAYSAAFCAMECLKAHLYREGWDWLEKGFQTRLPWGYVYGTQNVSAFLACSRSALHSHSLNRLCWAITAFNHIQSDSKEWDRNDYYSLENESQASSDVKKRIKQQCRKACFLIGNNDLFPCLFPTNQTHSQFTQNTTIPEHISSAQIKRQNKALKLKYEYYEIKNEQKSPKVYEWIRKALKLRNESQRAKDNLTLLEILPLLADMVGKAGWNRLKEKVFNEQQQKQQQTVE